MTTFGHQLLAAAVAACVCALGMAVYDVTVREPRTPRLAVVDVARLYNAAELILKNRALAASSPGAADIAALAGVGPAPAVASLRQAADFGPALESVLAELSVECRCAIVAMATVFGTGSTLPDFTQVAGERLGIHLTGGPAR